MPLEARPDYDLTVITATCRRPAQLANCLFQFQQQSVGTLRCQHSHSSVVVTGGLSWISVSSTPAAMGC